MDDNNAMDRAAGEPHRQRVSVSTPRRFSGNQTARASLTGGMLLAGAPLPVLAAHPAPAFADGILGYAIAAIAAAAGGSLLTAGLIATARPGPARILGSGGVVATAGLAALNLLDSPGRCLATLLGTALFLSLLWYPRPVVPRPGATTRLQVACARSRGASITALALWFRLVMHNDPPVASGLAAGFALLVATTLGLDWAWAARHHHRSSALSLWGLLGVFAAGSAWSWLIRDDPQFLLHGAALQAGANLTVVRAPHFRSMATTAWDTLVGSPERLLAGTFLGLCGVGTAGLLLPQSASNHQSIGLLDALFSSVSAVCVTGLIVLDTPRAFSLLGQVILLVLIQLGGLGIMTFSTAAAWAFGMRMSMRHEQTAAHLLSAQDRSQLFVATRRVLAFTFVAEAAGACGLFFAFLDAGDSPRQAGWRALFTSVSAFCNAGFALQTDSLVPYQQAPLVLHLVAALIILGGLSPVGALALPAVLRRDGPPVPVQVKLALTATAVMLGWGFLLILAMEWNEALGHLSYADRIHNAWFQSVTLRTAGFNSIDTSAVGSATLTLFIVWMLIGGCPGGTAGGIKTTTAAILMVSVSRFMAGQSTVHAFGRRIADRSIRGATVVVTVAIAVFFLALSAIQLTQDLPYKEAQFEVVSALGTVGLSLGGTAKLDEVGKILIAACMFIGRVGAIAVLLLAVGRTQRFDLARPEETIELG